MRSRQNPAIRQFICDNVENHPDKVVSLAIDKFGLSRTAINHYMQQLVEEGILTAQGQTKARKYQLAKTVDIGFHVRLNRSLEEDAVWRYQILSNLKPVKQNIIDICEYGFTEILNNALDHSASMGCWIHVEQTIKEITISISDEGVGIFNKLQKDFNLPNQRSALLELSKGRLTSDKKNHAGEGIFYTSRMFTRFCIISGELYYTRRKEHEDLIVESGDQEEFLKGTYVKMSISVDADWTTRDIFNEYQGKKGFRRTDVMVKLAQYDNEQFVSRSQAKRIVARFQDFSEVLLDFNGIEMIGQAFADEIFRVFQNNHPGTKIKVIGTTDDIDRMIEHVQS